MFLPACTGRIAASMPGPNPQREAWHSTAYSGVPPLPQMSKSIQIGYGIALVARTTVSILAMALTLLLPAAESGDKYSPEKAELSARGGRKATGHRNGTANLNSAVTAGLP